MAKFPKTIEVHVTQQDINEGKCSDPNKCMIKLAVKRAIGGHGYVHVDATGIAITRRADYREKAFAPRLALKRFLDFDTPGGKERAKPFSFRLTFFKTTKIYKLSTEERARKSAVRAANGRKKEKYNIKQRLVGVALALAKDATAEHQQAA